MLLEEIHKIVKKGSQTPLEFWIDDLNIKKVGLLKTLQNLASTLEADTQTRKDIDELINVLKQTSINELSLSKALIFIPTLFDKKEFAELEPLLKEYTKQAKTFNDNALLSLAMANARMELKARLKPEVQKKQDLELFQQGGMFYCLEYYLMLFKKINDSATEDQKKVYFEAEELVIDSIKLPGLWIDFQRNEVLEKFIYLILDDKVRDELVKAYFATKEVIMNIERSYVGKVFTFSYTETSLPQAVDALRRLIITMIKSFQTMGIERLGSQFLKPYGDKTPLKDLLNKL